MFLDYEFKQKLVRATKCIFRNFVIETKDIITGRNYFVIASHKSLASYSELYLGKDKELVTKKRFVFNIKKRISEMYHDSGLVVIKDSCVAKHFKSQVLMQPNFIELEIPLPGTLDEFYKMVTGDVRNNLKKVNKKGFTYTTSNDIKWVDEFYLNYYLPSMHVRHDDAYIMSKSEMIKSVKQPGVKFIKVYLENQCIAAAIAVVDGKKYSYAKVGWLNGDSDILASGAVTAIYQQLIERAYINGCNTISLGGTPPFLESGVLRYKAKWQSKFCPEIYYAENFILLSPENINCYQFLTNNSLVVFGLNKQLIVLSGKSPTDTHVPGIIFDDLKGWFILKPSRSESYPEGMDDLPEHLRYWYDKVN